MTRRIAMVLAASVALTACGGAGGDAGSRDGTIEFREIASGGVPGQEAAVAEALVIRSAGEVRSRLAGRVNGPDLLTAAAVDFEDRALVAVFAGQGASPAVQASVESLRVDDDALEVEVNLRQQGGPAADVLVGLYVLLDVAAADIGGVDGGTVTVKTVKGRPVPGGTPDGTPDYGY